MGPGTLSRRLVLRVTALVALVTVALSLFTALASFQILQQQLDSRLQTAASRPLGRSPGSTDDQPGDLGGAGLIRIDAILTEDASGNVVIARSQTTVPDGVSKETAAALLLAQIGRIGHDPTSVAVQGAGAYRILVVQRQTVTTLVGLPYSEVSRPMGNLLVMAALLTAAAVLAAFVLARRVVASSLRPLNRLAATANHVSNLPLERGAGQVPIRVAPADASPVSEVGQVGLAFNHMLDNVENALAVRHQSEMKVRQFVADASHELRNPLASIRGYAELTRRGSDQLPEDAAYSLGRIESESDRMSALVEDLLLLARLDSEPTLDLQPVDVTEMLLNAVSDARAADAGHVWALDLPEEPVTARADPNRLHQVVANLLGNARRHTPDGTRVEASLRATGGNAEITVTDNGPGVPPEIQPVVFERFTRADVSRVRQGNGSSTGLGLAIVSAVVKAHGGQVALESSPGHTRFTVRIPLI
jgi:two-component system OmpR family sensor kinase